MIRDATYSENKRIEQFEHILYGMYSDRLIGGISKYLDTLVYIANNYIATTYTRDGIYKSSNQTGITPIQFGGNYVYNVYTSYTGINTKFCALEPLDHTYMAIATTNKQNKEVSHMRHIY